MHVRKIPCEQVFVGDRQRSDYPEEHIRRLAEDIKKQGLIHAITIDKNGVLCAGFCRLHAIKLLEESYYYAGDLIPPGTIPAAVTHHDDERQLFELELSENLRRKNLSPMDEARAVARLHHFLEDKAGGDWSKRNTQQELDKLRGEAPERAKSTPPTEVADSILIAGFSNDPEVSGATSRREAVKIAKKKMQQQLTSALGALVKPSNEDLQIIHGNCHQVLESLPVDSFHGIVCDPPYGMDADSFGEQTTVGGHTYEDSWGTAEDLLCKIFFEGYRITKADAHIYVFCDIRKWPKLFEIATKYSWHPYATPLIWHKAGLGHAPQVGYFTRRYEAIFFASKGNRKLTKSRSDVFDFPPVKDKIHAAQKPVDLIRELLGLSFFPGEHILDPCAGSGSIFAAAKELKMKATGIELDEQSVNLCKQVIGDGKV